MKKKFSRAKLLKWLKSAVGITLLSINFSNDVSTVVSNITSPWFVAQTIEKRLDTFPKGMYIVIYERSSENEEQEEVPYSKTVVAIAYNADNAVVGKVFNLSQMLTELWSFEYIISNNNKYDGFDSASIIVKQPKNPLEFQSLLKILNNHANFVTVEDGSGQISNLNSFINGKKIT